MAVPVQEFEAGWLHFGFTWFYPNMISQFSGYGGISISVVLARYSHCHRKGIANFSVAAWVGIVIVNSHL
jgi:hypothetical protein